MLARMMEREGALYWTCVVVSFLFLMMGIFQQAQEMTAIDVIARLELLFFLGFTGLGYVCDCDTGSFVVFAIINLNAAIATLVSIWFTPDHATIICVCVVLIITLILEIMYDKFKKIRN
ncbi:MAG: hypothetical protein WCR70_03720 [Sphaerochaetaceae bacterium]